MPIAFSHARHAPADVDVLGVPVAQGEPPGPGAELSDAFLAERGFEAKVGETLAIPDEQGGTVIAVGVGDSSAIDATVLRKAAAAFTRAAWKDASIATTLLDAAPPGPIRVAAPA